jgi:hypothetical protein
MKILSFNKLDGNIIGDVDFTKSSFTFSYPEPSLDDEIHIDTDDFERSKPVFIEKDSSKKMLSISNNADLRAYMKLTDSLHIDMSDRKIFNSSTNPITDIYDKWMRTWRIETLNNAYEWREGLDTFVDLKRDKEVVAYLSKLEDVMFVIHDGSRSVDEVVAEFGL